LPKNKQVSEQLLIHNKLSYLASCDMLLLTLDVKKTFFDVSGANS